MTIDDAALTNKIKAINNQLNTIANDTMKTNDPKSTTPTQLVAIVTITNCVRLLDDALFLLSSKPKPTADTILGGAAKVTQEV